MILILEELSYILDVMNSVYDESFKEQPFCNVLQNVIANFYSSSFSFLVEKKRAETLKIIAPSFWSWSEKRDFIMLYLQNPEILAKRLH